MSEFLGEETEHCVLANEKTPRYAKQLCCAGAVEKFNFGQLPNIITLVFYFCIFEVSWEPAAAEEHTGRGPQQRITRKETLERYSINLLDGVILYLILADYF